jgi:prepilin-type N-terminal cleavage/methylation domain-containing protein
MLQTRNNKEKGFSLLELMIAMTVMLILLGVISVLFAGALSVRSRESRQTDALTSAQAALNVISREVSNAGYGLAVNRMGSNGLVLADCNEKRIHFRANVNNSDLTTNSPGEDVTYFFEDATKSIVRYDPNDNPTTAVVVNRISDVNFKYFNYSLSSSTPTETLTPTSTTGRVQIIVSVELEPVQGQPSNQTVTFTSEVTLRNSNYMLNQY